MMTRSRSRRLRLARAQPMAPPPPPPPELFHDAIAEILLRLPPDEPACLVRASLVCKLWRRILSDSNFPHRYREFHRTPPLHGFVCSGYSKASRFVKITKGVPFLQPPSKCRALDCRHGRVLLDSLGGKRESLSVWDPVTGDHKFIADPDPNSFGRSGVVLCAAAGCNHRACHGFPFVVVLVNSPLEGTKAISALVYSSDRESDAWSTSASVQLPKVSHVCEKRGALVGDQIYFFTDTGILKYDLEKHCLIMISFPCNIVSRPFLMTMEDGSLGFAHIKYLTLHLWATKVNPNGSIGWVQDRVISLKNLVPVIPLPGSASTCNSVNIIGFAEGVDVLLLGNDASGLMLELKSGRFKKSNPEYHYYDVFPYLSFYIPDFDSRKSPLPVETKQ